MLPTIKKKEEKIVIVEMGAYRLGEIKTLCDIAQPQYSIITALGQQHIGLFGSQEKLIQAKSEIFTALPPDGIAFIEQEANFSKQALTFAKTNIITVGPHTNIFVSDVVETEVGQSGILNINSAKQAFTIPLHGQQVLPSVLLSVATAMQLGIKIERIIELLSSIPLPDQTFTIIKKGDITVLDDSYNASPSSFKAAINWAKKRPEELKILVTPGLIELGSASNSIHKELGELCRDVFAEVIFTGNGDKKAFEQGYGKTTLPRYSKNIDADLLVIEGKANINI
jgi:UDP-N-acetylmuramoyl-tripeptide--D-alanyl-D-alanine ligase